MARNTRHARPTAPQRRTFFYDGFHAKLIPHDSDARKKGWLWRVNLGTHCGFEATLYGGTQGGACLVVGCREFQSASKALAHWKGGVSPTGEPRPHMRALVRFAIAICGTNGWRF